MTLPEGSQPEIANNTIVQNSVGVRVDARVRTSAQLYANNIIVANDVGLQVDFLISGNEPLWMNNLVYNNITNYSGIADQTGLNGNISVDPQFVSTRNFQLQATWMATGTALLCPTSERSSSFRKVRTSVTRFTADRITGILNV